MSHTKTVRVLAGSGFSLLALIFCLSVARGDSDPGASLSAVQSSAIVEEDHELPIVYVTLHIGVGTADVTPRTAEVLDVLGRTWAGAGTPAITPDSLQGVLSDLGVAARSWSESGTTGISFWFPAGSLEAALPLAKHLIFDPVFTDPVVEASLKQVRANRRDPRSLAARADLELDKRIGLVSEVPDTSPESRDTLNADTLKRFHRTLLTENRGRLGAWGDFDSQAMTRILSEWQSKLPASGIGWTSGRMYGPLKPGIYVVDEPSSNVQVRWGRFIPGLERSSDTFWTHAILANLLGVGRIFYAARERGMGFDTTVYIKAVQERGWLLGTGSCRPDALPELLRLFQEEIHGETVKPLDRRELERSRMITLGGQIGALQRKRDVLDRKVRDAARTGDSKAWKASVDRIKAVSLSDLKPLLPAYDFNSESVLVLLGPYDSIAVQLEGRSLTRVGR